jgi:hypothetical protein
MKQLLFASLIALSLVSCGEYQPTADEKDRLQQEKALQEAQRETGLPAIHNFQEKKLLKQIYELRDNEKIVNYAYLYNEMQGKLVFIGKCIGYGIPYSTQYSNPQKVYHEGSQYGLILPQAEPNGLFMPASSDGTWVMLLDKEGTPHPVYIEPKVIVSPFPLTIN